MCALITEVLKVYEAPKITKLTLALLVHMQPHQ